MYNNLISVICCYNNKDILNNMLYNSIKSQSLDCEFVPINNINNKFKSAAVALNYGASMSSGKYLIFAHQDIVLNDNLCLESLINYFNVNSQLIIGFAGRNEDSEVYTNMTHGVKHIYAGEKRVVGLKEVQTLDESFIAISRELFNKYKFDEKTCDNWHLYTVDLCLTLREHNIKSYVVPCNVHHKSSGMINKGYYDTLDKVVKKHKETFDTIYTTCSIIRTSYTYSLLYRIYGNIKLIIKHFLYFIK
jgi:hypothetical protein